MQYLQHHYKTSPILTSLFTLLAAVLLPIAIHLAPPIQEVPIGALLLPMFYVPLIALILFGKTPALAAAVLSPALNFLISGNDQWSLMILLTIELTVFTLSIGYLREKTGNFRSIMLSILLAKGIGAALLLVLDLLPQAPIDYFIQSLGRGWPGIVVLVILGFVMQGKQENSEK